MTASPRAITRTVQTFPATRFAAQFPPPLAPSPSQVVVVAVLPARTLAIVTILSGSSATLTAAACRLRCLPMPIPTQSAPPTSPATLAEQGPTPFITRISSPGINPRPCTSCARERTLRERSRLGWGVKRGEEASY
ncbi:hypothetical protein KC19_1G216300 [Ceratodon purpureus]|uniref:Uncharacterized protein n=1 Tax=Ceratodon purpureus TaxID=3225 RepID=A0A8T0J7V1_CERPU|nr:hypothetical protein KC19_1G216300 [Ceratodon purpureus]